MPKDFMDRFDIIIPMVAPVEKETRDKIMDIMLNRFSNKEKVWEPKYSHEFITKYIAYCRDKKYEPKLNPKMCERIKTMLHELMIPKDTDEEQVKFSFRQLESTLRFAYASARLHLRDINEDDINLAFELKRKSFIDLGIIDETGNFSWAKLEDVDYQEISDKDKVRNLFKKAMPETGSKCLMVDLLNDCKDIGIDQDNAEEYIQKMLQKGEFMEPKRGELQRM
jgi:DNA replicative helicase MCM subunit Mcm2 (Cdc46/Mcm family)